MMDQKRIDTAAKLLAMAMGEGVTEHEADAFREKALEYMAKWGIEDAMLAEAGEVRDEMTSLRVRLHAPYAVGKGILLFRIAEAMHVSAIRLTGSYLDDNEDGAMLLFGYQSDVDRVRYLWINLVIDATAQITHVHPGYGQGNAKAYRAAWLKGFARRVGERLTALYAKAEQAESSGKAEIVLRDRSVQARKAMNAVFPRTVKLRSRVSSQQGYADGKEHGNRADLGQTRVGTKRGQIR